MKGVEQQTGSEGSDLQGPNLSLWVVVNNVKLVCGVWVRQMAGLWLVVTDGKFLVLGADSAEGVVIL